MDRLVKVVSIDEEFEKGRGPDKTPRRKRSQTEMARIKTKLSRESRIKNYYDSINHQRSNARARAQGHPEWVRPKEK